MTARYPTIWNLGVGFGLEVVEQDGAFLRFLAPVADDDAGTVDDFSGVAFAVKHT